MRWLGQLWARLRRWIRPGAAPWATAIVDEPPDRHRPRTIYLVGEAGHFWAAAMLCPCGCGEVIRLNLLRDARPCWDVAGDAGGAITIVPSVWRRKGCRSHFLVRRGRIEWCPAS